MPSKTEFSLRDLFALLAVGCIFATLVVAGCGDGVSGDPIKVTPTQVMRFSKVGLLPALGASRSTAQRMQNATQIRGIHQSFVLYSNSNNTFYPGYNSDGRNDFDAVAATQTKWGNGALHKDDISKVYAELLTGEYVTPEYIISPLDTSMGAPSLPSRKGTVTNRQYSYALLDMTAAAPGSRRREWSDTNNSQAPIVSDPSSDIRSVSLDTVTYHSNVPASQGNSDTDYQGSVAWNDNHVTFENQGQFSPGTLKMGSIRNEARHNPWKGNGSNDSAAFIW